jgi:anaerobic selenocysteine-containing dehydrogenase
VLALLEKSVGKPAGGGATSSGTAGQSLAALSDDTIAARLSAVKEAVSGDAGDRLAAVTLPATGHSGCGAVTNWMQWAREMFPTGFCEISVEDAASRGIADKDTVVVESSGIGVELKARITDRLKAGVLGVPGYDSRARALFSWESGSDGWFSPARARSSAQEAVAMKRVFVNIDRCIACRTCSAACNYSHSDHRPTIGYGELRRMFASVHLPPL